MRRLILNLICSIGLAANFCLAAQDDAGKNFEFQNSHAAGEDIRLSGKPWKEDEKNLILKIISTIQEKSPGLIQRATAYRPIRLYRTDQIGREHATAISVTHYQELFISDGFFISGPESQLHAITHEIVHLADPFEQISGSKAWLELVQPQIEAVKNNLAKIKPGLTIQGAYLEGGTNAQLKKSYDAVALQEGFPSLWASFSRNEALAEYTTHFLLSGYSPPEKIKALIESNLLSTPFIPDIATKYLHQGLTALENSRLDDALQAFDESIKLKPDLSSSYEFRAKARDNKKEFDRAIADYNQAIQLGGRCFFERGLVYSKKGEPMKAIADFSEEIKINPELEKGYEQRALEWIKIGEFDKAIEDNSAILKFNPDYWPAYGRRGDLWMEKKEYDKAIADFSAAIKGNPDFINAYERRARALAKKGDLDKALSDCNEIIRINPDSALGYYLRGLAWADKKESGKAIADLSEAIKRKPDYAEVYYDRGYLFFNNNELDKAIADFNEVVNLMPDSELGYFRRGIAWANKEDLDKAIADLSEAIKRKPDYAEAYYSRGRLWGSKKELDNAIADFDQTIKFSPNSELGYYFRGVAWNEKKEFAKAIKDLSEAIRVNPNFDDAYIKQAMIWTFCPDTKFRNGKKAVESAIHACELVSWKKWQYLSILASAYAETGDFNQAAKYQAQALQIAPEKIKADLQHELELYQSGKPSDHK